MNAKEKHLKCTCGHSLCNHKTDGDDGVRCKCGCTHFEARGRKGRGPVELVTEAA
jgi:hypothetical protein